VPRSAPRCRPSSASGDAPSGCGTGGCGARLSASPRPGHSSVSASSPRCCRPRARCRSSRHGSSVRPRARRRRPGRRGRRAAPVGARRPRLDAGRPGELRAEPDRRRERVDRRQPDGDPRTDRFVRAARPDAERPAQQRTGPGDDHAVTRARSRAGTGHDWPGDQIVVPPRAATAPSSTAASCSVIGADSRRRGINHSATDENAQQAMM
jgi:hypothetical protein